MSLASGSQTQERPIGLNWQNNFNREMNKHSLSVMFLSNAQVLWNLDGMALIVRVCVCVYERRTVGTIAWTEHATNIIHNIKMAPIVIMDTEIKFISSVVSEAAASIGRCQAASQGD